MFPSRNHVPKSHPTWAGTAPMSWKLTLAGVVLVILAVAAVL